MINSEIYYDWKIKLKERGILESTKGQLYQFIIYKKDYLEYYCLLPYDEQHKIEEKIKRFYWRSQFFWFNSKYIIIVINSNGEKIEEIEKSFNIL